MGDSDEREAVPEVEVERLPPREERARGPAGSVERGFGERAKEALDPVAAGLVVDLLDAVTRGPLTPLGLLGLPLGYWVGRQAGLAPRRAALLGLGIAVYCALPITAWMPLGTLTGIYLRFWRD